MGKTRQVIVVFSRRPIALGDRPCAEGDVFPEELRNEGTRRLSRQTAAKDRAGGHAAATLWPTKIGQIREVARGRRDRRIAGILDEGNVASPGAPVDLHHFPRSTGAGEGRCHGHREMMRIASFDRESERGLRVGQFCDATERDRIESGLGACDEGLAVKLIGIHIHFTDAVVGQGFREAADEVRIERFVGVRRMGRQGEIALLDRGSQALVVGGRAPNLGRTRRSGAAFLDSFAARRTARLRRGGGADENGPECGNAGEKGAQLKRGREFGVWIHQSEIGLELRKDE